MSVSGIRVCLTADDFDGTRSFYENALGLRVADRWSDSEGRGVIFEAGGATVEVLDREHAAYVDLIETGQRGTYRNITPVRLAFEVSDVGAMSGWAISAGARERGGIVETPWGDINRRIMFPNGQEITLHQRKEQQNDTPQHDI